MRSAPTTINQLVCGSGKIFVSSNKKLHKNITFVLGLRLIRIPNSLIHEKVKNRSFCIFIVLPDPKVNRFVENKISGSNIRKYVKNVLWCMKHTRTYRAFLKTRTSLAAQNTIKRLNG